MPRFKYFSPQCCWSRLIARYASNPAIPSIVRGIAPVPTMDGYGFRPSFKHFLWFRQEGDGGVESFM